MKRPHLDYFLSEVYQYYDLAIWSQVIITLYTVNFVTDLLKFFLNSFDVRQDNLEMAGN